MTSRRVARDVVLRWFRLERSYGPPALYRHPEWRFEDPLRLAVAWRLRARSDFAFLQVGAFDGLANDPIQPLVRAYGLRGIVVEPQDGACAALRRHYADQPQVAVVQAAIADADGEREFYTSADGPIQQASFSRAHLLRHKVPAGRIVGRTVRCVTVASLLREHGLPALDLLQIDAEGYDYEIVRTIDFTVIRPAIIRLEHAHLSDRDAAACLALLASHGYRFLTERRDTIALLGD